MSSKARAAASDQILDRQRDNPTVRSFVVQGWTESVLSCTRTSIWQMFPKGWIARPFQTHSQTTLIAVCFVSPARLSGSYVKHLRSIFKTKKAARVGECTFGSRTHGELCIVPKLSSPTPPTTTPLPQPFDLGSQKALGPAGFARLNPAADLIRGVFPFLGRVSRGDRISSAPKCFLFLPLFIFFPSLGGLCLSIRGPTHAPCHVLHAEHQRCAGHHHRSRCNFDAKLKALMFPPPQGSNGHASVYSRFHFFHSLSLRSWLEAVAQTGISVRETFEQKRQMLRTPMSAHAASLTPEAVGACQTCRTSSVLTAVFAILPTGKESNDLMLE